MDFIKDIFLDLWIIGLMVQILFAPFYINISFPSKKPFLLRNGLILSSFKWTTVGKKIRIQQYSDTWDFLSNLDGSKMSSCTFYQLDIHMKILIRCSPLGIVTTGELDFHHIFLSPHLLNGPTQK